MRPVVPKEIAQALLDSQDILFTTHLRSDGDAIGSEYALALALKNCGKTVRIINSDPVPENLRFLTATLDPEVYNPVQHDSIIAKADCIVLLDFNAASRMGPMAPAVLHSDALRVMIDHHIEPESIAHLYYGDIEACSTGQLVYEVLRVLHPNGISAECASAIYTAIMTDSGSFRYPRTTAGLHRIAADCLDHGADPVEIYRLVYDNYGAERTRLIGRVLSDLRILCDGQMSLLQCSQEVVHSLGASLEDVENLVSYGLSIRGVVVAVLCTELEEGIKISLRSRGDFSVQVIAKLLGGGGHHNAAGATIVGLSMSEVITRLMEEIARRLSH